MTTSKPSKPKSKVQQIASSISSTTKVSAHDRQGTKGVTEHNRKKTQGQKDSELADRLLKEQQKTQVQLIQRGGNWQAKSGKGIWEAGSTPESAYKKLISRDDCGEVESITVDTPKEMTQIKPSDVWALNERFKQ